MLKPIFKIIFFILLFSILLFSDLFTKYLAENKLQNNNEIILIKNHADLSYTRNYDIGFSAFRFVNKYLSINSKKIIIICIQLTLVLFIFFLFLKGFLPYNNFTYSGIAFLTSGALGNITNRIIYG